MARSVGQILISLLLGLIIWGVHLADGSFAQSMSKDDIERVSLAIDANSNRVIDDAEIKSAIRLWISGEIVPGTEVIVDDQLIRELIRMWVSGEAIASMRLDGVHFFDIDPKGRIIVDNAPLLSAPATSTVVILGKGFPQEPKVEIDGEDIFILDNNQEAIITYLPLVGTTTRTVSIVVSDRANSLASATTSFTIDPPVESPLPPEKIIRDFVNIARIALASDKNNPLSESLSRDIDKLEDALTKMSGEETKNIARAIYNSNSLELINKLLNQSPSPPSSLDVEFGAEVITVELVSIAVGVVGLVVTVVVLANPGPDVTFEDITSEEPLEGETHGFTCVGEDGNEIADITISRREGSDVRFLEDDGSRSDTRTLVEKFPGDSEIEKFSKKWTSDVTGNARKVEFTCSVADAPWVQVQRVTTVELTFRPLHEARPPEIDEIIMPESAVVGQLFQIDLTVTDEFSPERPGRPSGVFNGDIFILSGPLETVSKFKDEVEPIFDNELKHFFTKAEFRAVLNAKCTRPGIGTIQILAVDNESDSDQHKPTEVLDEKRSIDCLKGEEGGGVLPPKKAKTGFKLDPFDRKRPGEETRVAGYVTGGTPPYVVAFSIPQFDVDLTKSVDEYDPSDPTKYHFELAFDIPRDTTAGAYSYVFNATDSLGETADGTGTFEVLPALPDEHQAPTITGITFPAALLVNEQGEGLISFADPDGDVNTVEYFSESFQPNTSTGNPNVLGQTSGSFPFTSSCTAQPGQITVSVILRDSQGNASPPRTFSYNCVSATGTAPSIGTISFPSTLGVNQSANGVLSFSDPDGDVIAISLQLNNGTPSTWDPGVSGQTSGMIAFEAGCSAAPGEMTLVFTIQDDQGNIGLQKVVSYTCVAAEPSPPTIVTISFPITLYVGESKIGSVFFNDPDGDITLVTFQTDGADPPSTSWDPGVQGQTRGALPFQSACNALGQVNVWVTLSDSQGHTSEGMGFSYTCLIPAGSGPGLGPYPEP